MRDSVEFLRSKAKEYEGEYNPEPSRIFKAAGKEIARLRRRLAEARLTDAEREAVDRQAKWLFNQAKHKPDIHSADLLLQEAATLRGLLERTK
jgi:hypothetical protein